MIPTRIIHPISEPAQAPREWLIANGLGGYACGPLAGPPIRRYHGWLVAALPPPWGRTMLVNRMIETIHLTDDRQFTLGAGTDADALLTEFRLEWGLPVWRFQWAECVIERRLVMEYGHNVTHARWQVLAGPCRGLTLQPWIQARPHGLAVDAAPAWGEAVAWGPCLTANIPDLPPLRFVLAAEDVSAAAEPLTTTMFYANEAEGGDPAQGPLWSPGHLLCRLDGDHPAALTLGCEIPAAGDAFAAEILRRRALLDRAHPSCRDGVAAELVLAADSFVVQPRHRTSAPQARTIMAGYHWFADWGRDTMIALEGLTLVTGRIDEAKAILHGFAGHVRHGLIPNMFPDGHEDGLYNTADASLWFFHAVDRVVAASGDLNFLRSLMPVLTDILDHHRAGTRFGIAMDPADGLLRQGQAGLQLTWMDAKVQDWVVTPRRGKAVEINALWHNAVACMGDWQRLLGQDATETDNLAGRIRAAFNHRFWSEERGYLYDVVDGEDGDDPTLRPNQLLAISLPHPVLAPAAWPIMLATVRRALLTPVGLRSLAPDHPAYRPHFTGDRWARDGAYHQGTVWAWLIGPFAQAWLKAHPNDTETVAADLAGFVPHLSQFGLGTIAEVFDGAPPHTPRGCISQAWSVAEWLRTWTLLP
ncbi:amylo-alpha-1,6-glucosidase [Magnetospirillum sulfuroxidans]|uniref:Glycogen debranching enzyme family protein n=1 Tax=Magnetospirillum sulfuroxidans TaxID=611300 RepID=A0ABS5IB34_9PROT|nr:amylo-alpha-1,6-glucosidase [Magnetospirillum sulfuroxidans]MBR9970923.1 glycogen debranching enzyme family protein [Magnetospirillum sulfuroxidans]